MILKVKLSSQQPIVLPRGFAQLQQAMIYRFLNPQDAKWLHDVGFRYGSYSFKLFTYSSFFEGAIYNEESKCFIFPPTVSFCIASPVDWIIEQLGANLQEDNGFNLGIQEMQVEFMEVEQIPKITLDKIKVQAISPIEVHTTNKKKTTYYSPHDIEFNNRINQNLQKKWLAFNELDLNRTCPFSIKIQPLFKEKPLRPTYFGYTIVKGSKGTFLLEGNPEFLHFALEVGLGSKSSQGYGMIRSS